jgi:hypothetical protein
LFILQVKEGATVNALIRWEFKDKKQS